MATITGTDASDFLVGTADADLVNGGLGNDTIRGLGGNDTLNGAEGADDIDGGDGNDYLIGGAGDDTLQGGMNADTLEGGAGNDVLRGGKGFDSIDGGDGDDTIYSGLGQDTLTGGAGADVFVLRGDDPNFPGALKAPTITDFVAGTDTIAIEGATADEITTALTAQTTVDGGVSFEINGATVVVKGTGLTSLSANDVTTEDGIPENNPGQTFTLTNSTVTGSFDNVAGTSGNDTIQAGPATLETGDVISGGAGTDTLTATFSADGSIAPTVSGVEKLFVRSLGNDVDATVSLTNVTGATELWADRIDSAGSGANDASVVFTGVTTSQTLGIKGGTSTAADRGDVTWTLTGVSGTSDSVNMSLDGASVNNATVANVETVNISTAGSDANRIDGTLTTSSASSVVITGAANVRIDATDFANTGYTVDASAFTGNLNITLEDQASGNTSVTGGSGDDSVYLGTGLDANDVIDGGAGTDTIGFTTAADLTAATGALLKNFEVFDAAGAGAGTYDMDLIDGGASSSTIQNVSVSADVGGAVVISNLVDTGAVTIGATTTAGLTINQKGAGDAGSNSDTLTFNVGTGATANVTVNALTAANVETITLNSVAVTGTTTGHVLTDGTFANATTLTITGDEQLTINGLTGSTGITSINASAMTDKLIFGAAADMTMTGVVLVQGGSAADTLFLEENVQSAASVIQGNGGADNITIADAGANNKGMIIKYVAQSDSTGSTFDKITGFTAGAGADADDIDLAFLGFTGGQAAVFSADAKATVANATQTFTISGANAAGFFNDSGTLRGVAWASDGTDSVFFVDANKDGNWSAADDMAIYLVGTNLDGGAPANGDFVFA